MSNDTCLCGSEFAYKDCCQIFHSGIKCKTTLELLKARFCAFKKNNTNFLIETHHPSFVTPQLISDLEDTSFNPSNLKIHTIEDGQAKDNQGSITYSFQYSSANGKETFTTTSLYSRLGDQWFYEKDT